MSFVGGINSFFDFVMSGFGNLCDQFKAEMMQEQFAVEVNGELLIYDDFVENFAKDLKVWENFKLLNGE